MDKIWYLPFFVIRQKYYALTLAHDVMCDMRGWSTGVYFAPIDKKLICSLSGI